MFGTSFLFSFFFFFLSLWRMANAQNVPSFPMWLVYPFSTFRSYTPVFNGIICSFPPYQTLALVSNSIQRDGCAVENLKMDTAQVNIKHVSSNLELENKRTFKGIAKIP